MSNNMIVRAMITASCALAFAACSSSNNTTPPDGGAGRDGAVDRGTAGTTGTAGGTAGTTDGAAGTDAAADADAAAPVDGGGTDADGGVGAPPALGPPVDRIGRPAINTAITDPFDSNVTAHEAKQDLYNAYSPTTAGSFEAAFQSNLAILDGLDVVCGNQFAANTAKTDPTRYKPLADVLLDDQLYIDSSSGTCAVYLGVEANATGIIPNTDCGGRTLTEDVIDVSYSVLATGMVSGVTDGVTADDKVTSATFPFLAAPN